MTYNRPEYQPRTPPKLTSVSDIEKFICCPLRAAHVTKNGGIPAVISKRQAMGVAVHRALALPPEKRAQAISLELTAFDCNTQEMATCEDHSTWASEELHRMGFRLKPEQKFKRHHEPSGLLLQTKLDAYCLFQNKPLIVEYKLRQLPRELSARVIFQTMMSAWICLGIDRGSIYRVVVSLEGRTVYIDELTAHSLGAWMGQNTTFLRRYRGFLEKEFGEVLPIIGPHCNACEFKPKCIAHR